MWIGLGVFFAAGAGLSMLVKQKPYVPRPTEQGRSYFGVDGFQTSDRGLTFDVVEPEGGPADKAGLVGGDIITSFNGRPVKTIGEIIGLLRETPIGMSVEVIYIRDGVIKKTQLTTESEGGIQRLRKVGNRPEGVFGFDSDRTTRINRPETRIYGVRIDYVEPNGPADLFGIKEGDIVTDFDKIPIRTSKELLSRVRRAVPGRIVEVIVLRGPETHMQTMKISVTMGRSG